MSKKNAVLGAVLGLFILGLFYSRGLNMKTVWIVAGLVIASYAIMFLISPDAMWVINAVSAFLGYKWAKEHNKGLEESISA